MYPKPSKIFQHANFRMGHFPPYPLPYASDYDQHDNHQYYVPVIKSCMKLVPSSSPESTVDETVRVRWVVPDTVKYGRRFRSASQPISDDGGVT